MSRSRSGVSPSGTAAKRGSLPLCKKNSRVSHAKWKQVYLGEIQTYRRRVGHHRRQEVAPECGVVDFCRLGIIS